MKRKPTRKRKSNLRVGQRVWVQGDVLRASKQGVEVVFDSSPDAATYFSVEDVFPLIRRKARL